MTRIILFHKVIISDETLKPIYHATKPATYIKFVENLNASLGFNRGFLSLKYSSTSGLYSFVWNQSYHGLTQKYILIHLCNQKLPIHQDSLQLHKNWFPRTCFSVFSMTIQTSLLIFFFLITPEKIYFLKRTDDNFLYW